MYNQVWIPATEREFSLPPNADVSGIQPLIYLVDIGVPFYVTLSAATEADHVILSNVVI
jgi:hypothetical protein